MSQNELLPPKGGISPYYVSHLICVSACLPRKKPPENLLDPVEGRRSGEGKRKRRKRKFGGAGRGAGGTFLHDYISIDDAGPSFCPHLIEIEEGKIEERGMGRGGLKCPYSNGNSSCLGYFYRLSFISVLLSHTHS